MRSADDDGARRDDAVNDTGIGGFVAFCIRQIEVAITEAFRDLDELSGAVIGAERASARILRDCPASPAAPGACGAQGRADVETLQSKLHHAARRLQALDRLQQRLDNACGNLRRAGNLMNSAALPIQENVWQDFLHKARLAYTMEDERRMFDRRYEPANVVDEDESDQEMAADPLLF